MAEIIGVSQVSLVHWRKDGCPVTKRGARWFYDSGAVIEWMCERAKKSIEAPEANEERARLTRAQAELKEMDIAVRRGGLVEIAQVEKTWANMVTRFKAKILQLPSRGAELSGQPPAVAQARLKALLFEALQELADDEHIDRKRAEDGAVVGTTTGPDGE